jgi:hypothetical protein
MRLPFTVSTELGCFQHENTRAPEVTCLSSEFLIVRMESKAEIREVRPHVSFVHVSTRRFSQGSELNTLQLLRRPILSHTVCDINSDQHTRIPLFHCLK